MFTKEVSPVIDYEKLDRLSGLSGYTALKTWSENFALSSVSTSEQTVIENPHAGSKYKVVTNNNEHGRQGRHFRVGFERLEPTPNRVIFLGRFVRTATNAEEGYFGNIDVNLFAKDTLAWRRENAVTLDLIPRHFTLTEPHPKSSSMIYQPTIIRVQSSQLLDSATAEDIVADVADIMLESSPA